MRCKILMLLMVIVLFAACSQSGAPDEVIAPDASEGEIFGTFTMEELESDAMQLMNILKAYSPGLYTDTDELESVYGHALSQLEDGMTGLGFMRTMKQVIAAVRCGHTQIYTRRGWDDIVLMPMDVKVIDGRLYMLDCFGKTDIQKGSEILEINGRTSEEILEKMLHGMSADGYNTTMKTNYLSKRFAREYLFHIEYAESFEVRYEAPGGKTGKDTIASMRADKVLKQLNTGSRDMFKTDFNDGYAVLTVRTFSPYGKYTIEKINEIFDEFFAKLREKDINNLILDIRGNGGGDPWVSSHLFSYLEKEPHPYFDERAPNFYPGLEDDIPMAENHFDGNLYVLTDGGCFSSTGHLLSLLRYQGVGTFIGEESGGSYACSDSSKDRELSNTGLTVHFSTMVWETAVDGMTGGRGIMPDHEISMTLEDYLNDNDPVMDHTLNLITD